MSRHHRVRMQAGACLFAIAAAVGCDVTESGGPVTTGGRSSAGKTPTPGPSVAVTAKPSSKPSNSGTSQSDIESGLDTDSTPAPLGTGDQFVQQPTPTPTPLGAPGERLAVSGARGLAVLGGQLMPYVLRQADLQEFTFEGKPQKTYGSPISQPVALAADGVQNLWVLSASPPHVDRFQNGILGLDQGTAFDVDASAVALAARDGEVWVAAAAGSVLKYTLSSGATESFSGFGTPKAMAVGTASVWVSNAGGEVIQIRRTDGARLATHTLGGDLSSLAEGPDGAAWAADRGAQRAFRVAADGATKSLDLGAAPSAVAADARRVWISLPGKLAYFKPDGTKEGEFALQYVDAFSGLTSLTATHLAFDYSGRVWALDSAKGVALPVWGRKEGE